jgi:hypothetical protein
MSANKKQVGGQHYISPMQHWDYVLANNIPYLEAQIIKYVTRWRGKNGLQDLEKAQHFLEKLIEVNQPPINRDPTKVPEYKSDDVALNPTKPWPGRLYCTCELTNNEQFPCPVHKSKVQPYFGDDEPGPGYVNQDR